MARRFKREGGTWAVQATFEEIRDFLISEYRATKTKIKQRKAMGLSYSRPLKRLAYLAVLLIQARNGCRVGEAVEALQKFISTGEQAVYVRVEKKYKRDRKTKKVERITVLRKVFKPKTITREDLALLSDVEVKTANVKAWASSRLGLNTHAIRHAFITHLTLKRGVNPATVAKMIEWSNLNMLLTYISKKEAEEVLEEIVEI